MTVSLCKKGLMLTVTMVTAAHLDGSLEELNGDVMLPLQTETVSCYTPGLQTDRQVVRERSSPWTGVVSGQDVALTSGQFLSMSVRSLDRADSATSFCRCHSVVE